MQCVDPQIQFTNAMHSSTETIEDGNYVCCRAIALMRVSHPHQRNYMAAMYNKVFDQLAFHQEGSTIGAFSTTGITELHDTQLPGTQPRVQASSRSGVKAA